MKDKNPLFEIGAAMGLMKKVNPVEAWKEIDEREVRELAKDVKRSPEVINDMEAMIGRAAGHVEVAVGQAVTTAPLQPNNEQSKWDLAA